MQFLNKLQIYTLYFFFFSINFEMLRPIVDNESFSASKVTGILYFLMVIPQYKLFFKTENIKRFLIPLFLYIGLETFMNLINLNAVSNEIIHTSLLLNIIFFWFMINHERKEHLVLEKGMLSFAFGAIALSLFYVIGIGVNYEAGRLAMFGDDQNIIGFRTSIGIIVLVLTVLQNRLKLGWSRYLFLIPIPLMLKLISETGSRGAMLTFMTACLVGIIMFKTTSVWKKTAIMITGFLFLIIVGLVLLESETMVNRLKKTNETGDTAGRTEIWQNIIQIIKDHPVFGIGRSGYTYESSMIYGEEVSPHNVILELLCYTGIVGLLIYLYFLYQIGISSYNFYQKTAFLLPLLLMVPIFGIIMSIQILTKKLGWIVYAYIVGTLAIKQNTSDNEHAK